VELAEDDAGRGFLDNCFEKLRKKEQWQKDGRKEKL
jgi:hypothetical protein